MTGAASLVGAEVLRQLLRRHEIESLQLLMPNDAAVATRLLQRLESQLGPLPQSVSVVNGDLRLARFGLSAAAFEQLGASFDVGIHCAQRETKDHDLEAARQFNLLPIESWIDLLERNPLVRLHQLSTAFTAGTHRGLYTEFDLECGQQFHNAFEQSKYEAEVRLRESRVTDRVTIHRPSHTLGCAATGDAFELSGAYPLIATIAAAAVLPGDARARIDFVPADFVADAMTTLIVTSAAGTFHHALGWHASPTVREVSSLAAKGLGRKHGARLLPRGVASPLRIAGAANPGNLTSPDLAYTTARDLLHQGPVFDTYLAQRALSPLGIAPPAADQWLTTAVRAANAREWKSRRESEPQEPSVVVPIRAAAAALAAEKQFHRVGDVNVAYRDIGSGDPVVFLHGISGAQSWDGVVERIATRRRAIVIETLGLGDTEGDANADYGLAAQAVMVRGLLSALDISTAHIVGNDSGGVIAQFFAVRWPHLVRSLVLSDCDTHGPWPPAHLSRASRQYPRKPLKQFMRALERTDRTTLNHLLGRVEAPTLIVWGGDHGNGSLSWARTLYDAIPGARRLEIIPFAGVACHEERPDLFARALTDFLEETAHQSSGTSARTSRV
ncbi:MAG TPA: alpha/beta fold hydrolase [Thermoanaerobaculia bacterium]|nr:alpha/beta fold hydrolase [Thermoanaerobaculia bacterium]